jgi:ABC-type glycerol-3-phosphate transport system substrate-binding protein
MRRVMILLVIGVLAIAAAGCGGSDETSGTDTTAVTDTTTEETTTTEATDTETTTDTETATDTDTGATGSGNFASGDCLKLVQSSQELTQALSAAGSGGDLKDAAKLFQAFVDKAPDDIKVDLQVLADAYSAYAGALGDVNLQAGETPSPETLAKLQKAATSIDTPKVTAASERLGTWANEHCPNSG